MTGSTDIKRIMDRIMRHPMLRDIPFETAVEYAVDFIQLIGAPGIYNEKTAYVQIRDWRGELPCDFHKIIQVRMKPDRDDGCQQQSMITFRYSADSFHMSDNKRNVPVTYTYKLQGSCIFASVKDADLEIAYWAIATDADGFPLLPDNASFLRGLEAYIKLQWFTVLFDLGKIPMNVLQNVQQEYAWAAGDAQSEFGRLSIDQAETLFNSMNSLLPRTNSHWRGFFDTGTKEMIIRH